MTEDWRKEFDEKFVFREEETADEGRGFVIGEGLREDIGPNEIKQFIEALLTTRTEQAVAEERERVRELVEGMRKESGEIHIVTELEPAAYHQGHFNGYNTALSDLSAALQDPRRGGEKGL